MPLIDLIRHGEVDGCGRLLGRTDVALSPLGWEQFERQTVRRPWASIRTSPLQRACAPAEKLAQRMACPLTIDADWAEIDFGAWDGCSQEELRADATIAAQLDAFYRGPGARAAPGGESWLQLRARVARAIGSLAGLPETERILVVTHGGPMRTVISLACGIALERTWAFRIDHGARLTLRIGRESDRLWGEIVELVQP